MTQVRGTPQHPLVTIGISTYNRVASTFPAALQSALDQDYPVLEIIVCDNASEDGTAEFMAEQRDPRLRYHRHPANIGPNANFNACLERAQGQYFLLLHDDDLLDPTFVTRAMAAIGQREPGVALSGSQVIDADEHVRARVAAPAADLGPAGLFFEWFERRTSFYLCSTLFHAQRLRAHGGFASPEHLLQDVVAIAELASRYGYVTVPGVGGSFRRHDANRGSGSHALRWASDAEYLLDVLVGALPDHADRLYELGAPYLSAKCYRYVVSVPSPLERWRLFNEIHARLGRAYAPWRFLLNHYSETTKALARALVTRPRRLPRG